MALADIFMLTDFQRLPTGESFENVYFYEATEGAGGAEDIALAFASSVRPSILAVQSAQVSHYLTRVISLGDPANFGEVSYTGVVGTQTADALPAFNAFGFTLRPSTREVRPGSKRIGGAPDQGNYYTNGVVTDTDMLGFLNTLRGKFDDTISGGVGVTMTPVIVKRVFVPATEDTKAYYRLPETDGELVSVPITNVLFNNKITHQTSRGNSR